MIRFDGNIDRAAKDKLAEQRTIKPTKIERPIKIDYDFADRDAYLSEQEEQTVLPIPAAKNNEKDDKQDVPEEKNIRKEKAMPKKKFEEDKDFPKLKSNAYQYAIEKE